VILRRNSPKLVLIGASLLTGLLVSELALRLAGFEFHLRPERITFAWKNSLASLGYQGDRDLLWVPAGYAQRLAAARAERPLIAFLGDSCTEYSKYPDLLLHNLAGRRPGVRWTGVSMGTAGWSSLQGLRQLRRDVLPLRPRVVTVYFGWNDHWIGFGLPDEEIAALLQRTSAFWQQVRLAQLGHKAYIAVRGSRENRRVPLPAFRRNLHEIVRLARSHGIEPVLVTAPSSHQRGREPRYLAKHWVARLEDLVPLHQQYVNAVRAVAAEDEAVLCDLAGKFASLRPARRDASFRPDGIHLTERGARTVATQLADCLEDAGVLDRVLVAEAAR
jgi:lysophospholipase L1-like esterase